MKKFIIMAMLFLVVVPSVAVAGANTWFTWEPEEKVLMGIYTPLHIIDWKQTRQIARHPERYYEWNPAMGEHPSVGQVDTYMALSYLAIAGSVWAFPPKISRWEMFPAIGLKLYFVERGFYVGLQVKL